MISPLFMANGDRAMMPIEYLYDLGPVRWGNPSESACLYYPGAYTDTGPLDLIMRSRSESASQPFDSFATAIYVDIAITPEAIEQVIHRIKHNYSTRTVLVSEILPADFGAFRYADFLPKEDDTFYESVPNYAQLYAAEHDEFFGLRAFFPELQLNLIYLKAEGIQAYRTLQKAKIFPNIVVLQDHGPWGYQYATFYGECLLYKAAKKLPRFLYQATEGEAWPGYEQISEGYCDEGQEHRYERCLSARKTVIAEINRRNK